MIYFWVELWQEMKPGFITMSLSQSDNPWNGDIHHPPRQKKFKTEKSAGKVMATVFWGIHIFYPKEQLSILLDTLGHWSAWSQESDVHGQIWRWKEFFFITRMLGLTQVPGQGRQSPRSGGQHFRTHHIHWTWHHQTFPFLAWWKKKKAKPTTCKMHIFIKICLMRFKGLKKNGVRGRGRKLYVYCELISVFLTYKVCINYYYEAYALGTYN